MSRCTDYKITPFSGQACGWFYEGRHCGPISNTDRRKVLGYQITGGHFRDGECVMFPTLGEAQRFIEKELQK